MSAHSFLHALAHFKPKRRGTYPDNTRGQVAALNGKLSRSQTERLILRHGVPPIIRSAP